MVGIVVVSHSRVLAEGVVELARQMGGDELALEAAGGLEDGSLGTDAARVREAIERAMSRDGVLVLMDLGSALMSAEMATELLDGDGAVELSEAPLVEGTVVAAAAARGGASLPEVAAEARSALRMKASQLGADLGVPPAAADDRLATTEPEAQARISIVNEIGLHARPAALVVELASRFDADLRLAKPGAAPPVSARSLTGLMTLLARRGDELVATASGPQAREALEALEQLTRTGFGEGVAAAKPDSILPPSGPQPKPPPPPEQGARLRGIAASPGVGLGHVRHLMPELEPPTERAAGDPETERHRLDAAREIARTQIEHDRGKVRRRGAQSEAAIFIAHLALLDDGALLDLAGDLIDDGNTAEAAWHAACEETAARWRALGDELLRERAADIADVGARVVAVLTGRDRDAPEQTGILIVFELTPADAVALDPELVDGIATVRGTATAHAAILARALGLPAVVGLGPSVLAIPAGTRVLLDGDEGVVVVAPGPEAERAARRRGSEIAARHELARARAVEPAVLRDGTRIEVSANIGSAGEAARAVELGADGVGLLRTEFLFLERREPPSEEEQAQALTEIATALGGRPLIVRTLDVGADKQIPAVPMAPERNPFLGRRGLRLSLHRPELLATQLRAIVRVAAAHPIKVMFPMVATAAELERALAALSQAREASGAASSLEAGIMVEVPAAALCAEQLARSAHFFSIGTNDLTQYAMAAERGNELVAELLAGPQPAVLRLVEAAVRGASAHGRWVGVCGELAGDPAAAILLVGLGARELSVAAPLISEVKEALRSIALADARAAAKRALTAGDADEARALAAALL